MADTKKPTTPVESEAGDANRDPLTGEPGSHPIGVGVGAAGGAAAGAALGSLAGPVGALVGSVVGGVAGALVGRGAAEAVDPTVEEEYWRQNYATRPYVTSGAAYETYQPAYQYGWESYRTHGGDRSFDDLEPELRSRWEERQDQSGLTWEHAKEAVRDAWQRVERRPARDAGSKGR